MAEKLSGGGRRNDRGIRLTHDLLARCTTAFDFAKVSDLADRRSVQSLLESLRCPAG